MRLLMQMGTWRTYVRWSCGNIIQRAESLAIWFQSQDCTERKSLVLFFWNSVDWVLFFWVAAKLRMPFVPLDPRVSGSAARDYIEMTVPCCSRHFSTTNVNANPPYQEKLVLAKGSIELYNQIVTAGNQVLEQLGLQWESHVQDMIPIRDCYWYIAEGSRPQSYHHRMRLRSTIEILSRFV
jgi:long-subunit acyl-CoA synthetase (AMP-forming)